MEVDLTQPWATFPNTFMTSMGALMMAPAMLASSDRGAGHPIGTGPFTFASWTKDSSFKTTRNTSYWQAGKPHLDELNFLVITDPSTQASALQAGDIDVLSTASYEAATTLEQAGFTVLKNWQSLPGMAMTNTAPDIGGKPNPVSNIHARKALAYATDQQALADTLGPGLELPKSPIPSASKWGLPDDQTGYPDFDLDQAKQAVDEYKTETGAPSLSIELSLPSDPDSLAVAQILQSQWEQAGIDTTLNTKLATAFISDVVVGNYQVALFSMYNAPDPDSNNLFWSSANVHPYGQISINFTRLTTPQMDADLAVGRREPRLRCPQARLRRPRQADQRQRRQHLDDLLTVLDHRRQERPRAPEGERDLLLECADHLAGRPLGGDLAMTEHDVGATAVSYAAGSFSDEDASGQAAEHAAYLDRVADVR